MSCRKQSTRYVGLYEILAQIRELYYSTRVLYVAFCNGGGELKDFGLQQGVLILNIVF